MTGELPHHVVAATVAAPTPRLRWPQGLSLGKGVYALVDEAGYVGMVEVVGYASFDCDDCDHRVVDAIWIEHAPERRFGANPRCGQRCLAIGPSGARLPRIRATWMTNVDRDGPTWAATARIDVDGDGAWDLETVERCGGTTASGCRAQVCSRRCAATRRVGELAPTPGTVACHAWIPDLEDCVP
ncbi:MAG: hypothetical protein SFX73_21225 [Kofleriaceae bacterium]|nr:hypothetical protein [Kofleriaceae bacterium]